MAPYSAALLLLLLSVLFIYCSGSINTEGLNKAKNFNKCWNGYISSSGLYGRSYPKQRDCSVESLKEEGALAEVICVLYDAPSKVA